MKKFGALRCCSPTKRPKMHTKPLKHTFSKRLATFSSYVSQETTGLPHFRKWECTPTWKTMQPPPPINGGERGNTGNIMASFMTFKDLLMYFGFMQRLVGTLMMREGARYSTRCRYVEFLCQLWSTCGKAQGGEQQMSTQDTCINGKKGDGMTLWENWECLFSRTPV